MSAFEQFEKYKVEILDLIEELKESLDDIEHTEKICKHIRALIEFIELIDNKQLADEDVDEVIQFMDYVKDVLKEYENNFEQEPNI